MLNTEDASSDNSHRKRNRERQQPPETDTPLTQENADERESHAVVSDGQNHREPNDCVPRSEEPLQQKQRERDVRRRHGNDTPVHFGPHDEDRAERNVHEHRHDHTTGRAGERRQYLPPLPDLVEHELLELDTDVSEEREAQQHSGHHVPNRDRVVDRAFGVDVRMSEPLRSMEDLVVHEVAP